MKIDLQYKYLIGWLIDITGGITDVLLAEIGHFSAKKNVQEQKKLSTSFMTSLTFQKFCKFFSEFQNFWFLFNFQSGQFYLKAKAIYISYVYLGFGFVLSEKNVLKLCYKVHNKWVRTTDI